MKNTEGWKLTKSLGMVYVDDNGCVVRTMTTDGWKPLFPYKWSEKNGCWTECSGEYKPAYLARKMEKGTAKWA